MHLSPTFNIHWQYNSRNDSVSRIIYYKDVEEMKGAISGYTSSINDLFLWRSEGGVIDGAGKNCQSCLLKVVSMCRLDAGHCTLPCGYKDLPLVVVHFAVESSSCSCCLAYIAPAVLAACHSHTLQTSTFNNAYQFQLTNQGRYMVQAVKWSIGRGGVSPCNVNEHCVDLNCFGTILNTNSYYDHFLLRSMKHHWVWKVWQPCWD